MAPREDLITPLGWEFIRALPPILQDDPDYRAIMHCNARELERLELAVEEVRAQFLPQTAGDAGLRAWEVLLRVPAVGDLEMRRAAVLARYQSLRSDPSGAAWVAQMNRRLNGAYWTYQEHKTERNLFVNLVRNPTGRRDSSGWEMVTGGPVAVAGEAFLLVQDNTERPLQMQTAVEDIPARPGDRLSLSAELRLGEVPRSLMLYAAFLDEEGDALSYHDRIVPAEALEPGWNLLKLEGMEAPAGAAFVQVAAGAMPEGVSGDPSLEGETHYVRRVLLMRRPMVTFYFDGETPGYEWEGTPDYSRSLEVAPAAHTLRIFLPFDSGSAEWNRALQAFDEETPTELALEFVSMTGFRLDISEMDREGLGI